MNTTSNLKKIYFTEAPVCYNIFKNERPSCQKFTHELFTNPNYQNELSKYKKSEGLHYSSPEDFYYDWTDLYSKLIFLESQNVLEIGIDHLLLRKQDLDEEER